MRRFLFRAAGTLALLVVVAFTPARAQDAFPSRPVEFIVPWGAGGGSDQTARALSRLLQRELKASFPVVNVPGGTGNAGMTKLLSAPPDGYTISLLAWDTLALLSGRAPPRWTPSQFAVLGVVTQQPAGLYVTQDSPLTSWEDLKTAAAARPGQLKVAVAGFGSFDEMTIRQLTKVGVSLRAVPYAEPGERFSALLGHHIDVMFSPVGNVESFVSGKQMRPLLFFGIRTMPGFESIPTDETIGLGISLSVKRGVIVRSGLPPERLKILSGALAAAVASPDYKEFLRSQSANPDSYVPPEAAMQLVDSDIALARTLSGR